MDGGPAREARDRTSDLPSIAVLAVLNSHLGHLVEPKLFHLASVKPQANEPHSTPAKVEHNAGGRGSPEPPQGALTDSQPYDDDRCPLPLWETIEVAGQAERRREAEQRTSEQEYAEEPVGRSLILYGNLPVRPSYSHATSADAGVELQVDVGQPARPDRHLVGIGPRQERRRLIGRHRVGSRREMDQEAPL